MAQALACLENLERVEIQEKVDLIEAATALLGAEIEMANKYAVLDDQGNKVLFAVEQTNCLVRQVKQCCADCAPWDLDILYVAEGSQETAFHLSRPWTLTCCCFNRPVVTVSDAVTQEVLGSIIDPFACCDLTFTVRDAQENNVLKASGGCCQWGLCCPLPCGPCATVEFPIEDSESGEKVGQLDKKVPSCLKFFLSSDTDNYKVEFGGVTNPQWKVMVIALAIFIDFRYFSGNENDDRSPLPDLS